MGERATIIFCCSFCHASYSVSRDLKHRSIKCKLCGERDIVSSVSVKPSLYAKAPSYTWTQLIHDLYTKGGLARIGIGLGIIGLGIVIVLSVLQNIFSGPKPEVEAEIRRRQERDTTQRQFEIFLKDASPFSTDKEVKDAAKRLVDGFEHMEKKQGR